MRVTNLALPGRRINEKYGAYRTDSSSHTLANESDGILNTSIADDHVFVGTPKRISISTRKGQAMGQMDLRITIESTLDNTPLGAGGPVLKSVLTREVPASQLLRLKSNPRGDDGRFINKKDAPNPAPDAHIELIRTDNGVASIDDSDDKIPRRPDQALRITDCYIDEQPAGRQSRRADWYHGTTSLQTGNATPPLTDQIGFIVDVGAALMSPGIEADHKTVEDYLTTLTNGVGIGLSTNAAGSLYISLPDGEAGASGSGDFVQRADGQLEDLTDPDWQLGSTNMPTDLEAYAVRHDIKTHTESTTRIRRHGTAHQIIKNWALQNPAHQ